MIIDNLETFLTSLVVGSVICIIAIFVYASHVKSQREQQRQDETTATRQPEYDTVITALDDLLSTGKIDQKTYNIIVITLAQYLS